MQKRFTLDDLAKYTFEVYQESHRSLSLAIRKEGPSALTVRNILQYSKALTVSQDSSGGNLFLLLN